MEDEVFINGFCKSQNQGRMFSVEFEENGDRRKLLSADCAYGKSKHQESCSIAKQISEEFDEKDS